MAVENTVVDLYKVCRKCNEVLLADITPCPNCRESNFRPMTREEKTNPVPIIFFTLQPFTQKVVQARGCNIFGD